MQEEGQFINYYRHCGQEWNDTWSCMCNDKCPVCNREIEPYDSKALSAADNEPTDEQVAALREYAAKNGRSWKSRLLSDWTTGRDERQPLLRQVRNQLGPEWLKSYRLPQAA